MDQAQIVQKLREEFQDLYENRLGFVESAAWELDEAINSMKYGVPHVVELLTEKDGSPKPGVAPEALALLLAWKAALVSWESSMQEVAGYVLGMAEEKKKKKNAPAA